MAERPILFSGPMVRAILDGRKTQTRRVVKPQSVRSLSVGVEMPRDFGAIGSFTPHGFAWEARLDAFNMIMGQAVCPYGVPGDVLWVKETHWCVRYSTQMQCGEYLGYWGHHVEYAEQRSEAGWRDGDQYKGWMAKRPSIHMPRSACRLTLAVKAVRVERLNEITYADCHAEGIEPTWGGTSEIESFEKLWDSINAKRHPWDSNPWVWVVEFAKEATHG